MKVSEKDYQEEEEPNKDFEKEETIQIAEKLTKNFECPLRWYQIKFNWSQQGFMYLMDYAHTFLISIGTSVRRSSGRRLGGRLQAMT